MSITRAPRAMFSGTLGEWEAPAYWDFAWSGNGFEAVLHNARNLPGAPKTYPCSDGDGFCSHRVISSETKLFGLPLPCKSCQNCGRWYAADGVTPVSELDQSLTERISLPDGHTEQEVAELNHKEDAFGWDAQRATYVPSSAEGYTLPSFIVDVDADAINRDPAHQQIMAELHNIAGMLKRIEAKL